MRKEIDMPVHLNNALNAKLSQQWINGFDIFRNYTHSIIYVSLFQGIWHLIWHFLMWMQDGLLL